MTALCNQPKAFASDLGDDQSHYLSAKLFSLYQPISCHCGLCGHLTGINNGNVQALPSTRQRLSYADCLENKREIITIFCAVIVDSH